MSQIRAEVISIGDELTSGQRLDTNSQWLSQRLGELGIAVVFHTTVADDLAANVEVFRTASQRADVVVSTGGLGPTADDLTREALAQLAGVELELDPRSLEHIRGLFARRHREMPERNVVQAMFPRGSRPIFNPEGTAPGIDLSLPRPDQTACRIIALPGVPAEMRQMWQATIADQLAPLGGSRVIRHRRIKCFGAGESDVEQMLPDLIRRGREPTVGITVSDATITLRITAQAATDDACRAIIEPTAATIYQCLGSLVFGEEDDELHDAVVRLLRQTGQSLATVEWGTAGLVADWLGAVSGDEGLFLGGMVAAGETSLAKALDLPAEQLSAERFTSGQAVQAMAAAVRQRFASDFGLAVGRFPRRVGSPSDSQHEASRLHVALATREGSQLQSVAFGGHSAIVKPRAAKSALNVLRLSLLDLAQSHASSAARSTS